MLLPVCAVICYSLFTRRSHACSHACSHAVNASFTRLHTPFTRRSCSVHTPFRRCSFAVYTLFTRRSHVCTRRSHAVRSPFTRLFTRLFTRCSQGDSGSPLLCRRDSHWMMVGVGSWSPVSCSAPDHPSGFVINAPFDAWIRSYIK